MAYVDFSVGLSRASQIVFNAPDLGAANVNPDVFCGAYSSVGCWLLRLLALAAFALLCPQLWSLRSTQTHQSARAKSLWVRFDILCPQTDSWSSGNSLLSQSLLLFGSINWTGAAVVDIVYMNSKLQQAGHRMHQSDSTCHHATGARSRHADLLSSLEISMIPQTWPLLGGTAFVVSEALAGSFVSVHCFLLHTQNQLLNPPFWRLESGRRDVYSSRVKSCC